MKALFALLLLPLLFSQAGAQVRPDALDEYRAGRYREAADLSRAEMLADARNIEAYVVLCWSLVKLGDYAGARAAAERALSFRRYDARVIEVMGEINYHESRHADALRYFQEYIALAPDGQRVDAAYYYMGEIYIAAGRLMHADIALATALHYAPANAVWRTRLGYVREAAGELLEALAEYEAALALDPQLAEAERGLARVRATLASRR
jgi:tetratricopeptide (TPR) repeat protein